MGLDENLPTFYLRQSKETKHDATVLLSQYGSDASPAYNLRHPDPAASASKNRYAAALYDSYNPEILFGEVLLIPEWTHPTLSQDELRRNGGVPPPPQPVSPNQFVVQLYNPDQQIVVNHRPSTWHSVQAWDFEMPTQTFRQPSISNLDRTQSDPTISEATPTVGFRWKREGKISKDLVCHLSGKSTRPDGGKRKQKEPDIPMAFFRNLQELSVYEPNLSRVDMEDPKGFEVVLLLCAAVIKDVYFSPLKDAFNIGEISRGRTHSNPVIGHSESPSSNAVLSSQLPPSLSPANGTSSHRSHRPSLSLQTPSNSKTALNRPPPTDPRSQWEIDAETARLRKQVEEEERRRKHQEKEELKNVKRMVEEEERQARRREAEIDKETERLRKEYETEQKRLAKAGGRPPSIPPRYSAPPSAQQQQHLMPHGGSANSPYLQAPGSAASTSYVSLSGQPRVNLKPKRSHFFGLRGGGEEESRLLKKSSAIF